MVSRTSETETLTGPNLWKQFKTQGILNGVPTRILIDTGSSGNFIHNELVQKMNIPYRKKQEPYPLSGFDGSQAAYGEGWVKIETEEATLQIGNHQERISLDVQRIPGHDIILGMPWIRTQKPIFDFGEGDSIIFREELEDLLRKQGLQKENGLLDTLRKLLSTSTREVASVRPECGNCVGDSDSGVSQHQDCDASSEASSVKCNPIAGISPTKRNDTPDLRYDSSHDGVRPSDGSINGNNGVRPSDGSINGNLKESVKQDQDSSVRDAASSVKCSTSSGVRPTESSIPDEQVQHTSRRTTRKRHKAKSKASRKQLAATEPQVDVQTISGEAFKRMRRQGQQVCLMYIKPSQAVQQRALAKAARERLKDEDSPTPIGGDDPARIRRGQHGSLETWNNPYGEPPIPEMETVPSEYWDLKAVCQERGKGDLPKHQPWDHEIPLKPGTKPAYKPIYSLSAKEMEALREYIEKNLERGYIRPSTSSAGYPILFVPKKNGKLRLCVDYRQLNDITIKNRYPLPRIDELQDKLGKAKYFTKLDLREGYHLVRIKEGEEWKTAFRTRLGLYEYTVMPFGLTNAPATFQNLVNDTLREYLDIFCLAYLDDILIFSETLEDHKKHVRKVLEALQAKNLSIAPEKCEWHVQRTEFLGFVITPGHVGMDDSKLDSIREWPVPKTIKEVQSFLGFANFYRKFIWNYSKVTEPLTRLTRKEHGFKWGDDQQQAFESLKRMFCEAPVLGIYDPDKPIEVETDASGFALGACLSQPDDQGRWHPIAFYSRKFTPAELNYDTHDKELLAIVSAFKQWRHYLEGASYQVVVHCDHQNLTRFTTTKELNRRQVRWSEEMASYDFKITHRKGVDNAAADALSRRVDYMEGRIEPHPAVFAVDSDGSLTLARPSFPMLRIESNPWHLKIREAYAQDSFAQELLALEDDPRIARDREGTLLFKGLIYVPARLREVLVKDIHEAPAHGHQGIDRTTERITRNFYFPGLRKTVQRIVSQCDLCIRSKAATHAPYGQLQPLEVPERPWQSVTLDFITKLPQSRDSLTGVKHDSVLVFVDRLTKYAYFLPYLEASNAEQLAHTFLRYIFADHGMPEELVSDRDKLMRSEFWQTLMRQLGAKNKLSTTAHPQTDGQTERMNRTLEQYLRCFVNYPQDDWATWLPMAQFAYNSAKQESTNVSPFFANYGFEPDAYREAIPSRKLAQQGVLKAEQLKELHKAISLDLEHTAPGGTEPKEGG
ncbi:hypothetical protein GTA08_BOTSDO05973 [Botryosphaeria dothidea]|uniref:Reverse transcriptase n=1 Tax=Botryosphaeria dothidea TaxID=55169 RepID=A0A8H4IT67_9PEZI|nr:hypothetical protein GTA08_BOTSDO05973 [Botryosphaeria dothidea]